MTFTLLAVLTVSVPALSLYVAPLVTIATDALTKADVPAPIAAGVHIFLAAVATVVTSAIAARHGLRLDAAFFETFGATVAISELTYYAGTRPLGISDAIKAHVPGVIGAAAPSSSSSSTTATSSSSSAAPAEHHGAPDPEPGPASPIPPGPASAPDLSGGLPAA